MRHALLPHWLTPWLSACWLGLLLWLLVACGGASHGDVSPAPQRASMADGEVMSGQWSAMDAEPGYGPEVMPADPMPAAAAAARSDGKGEAAPEGPKAQLPGKALARQLLVYTAIYDLTVIEVTRAIDAAQKVAEDAGGYLVRRSDHEITVRVPVDAYRATLAKMAALGEVRHREETVQDVTDQFYDLTVRLNNAKAMRDRLEQLLAQARNVEDALAVQRELARVTADIESMEGRLRLLKELIAFSTITLRFEEQATEQIEPTVRLPFGWLDSLGLSELLSL